MFQYTALACMQVNLLHQLCGQASTQCLVYSLDNATLMEIALKFPAQILFNKITQVRRRVVKYDQLREENMSLCTATDWISILDEVAEPVNSRVHV